MDWVEEGRPQPLNHIHQEFNHFTLELEEMMQDNQLPLWAAGNPWLEAEGRGKMCFFGHTLLGVEILSNQAERGWGRRKKWVVV